MSTSWLFLACQDLGGGLKLSFRSCSFFFFFWVEISSCAPRISPQSTVAKRFLMNCVWAHFPYVFRIYFFEWRSAHAHQFHSFGLRISPQSTVAKCFLMNCVWAHFPYVFPYYVRTAQSAPLWLCWAKGVCKPATCTLGRMTRVFYVPLR